MNYSNNYKKGKDCMEIIIILIAYLIIIGMLKYLDNILK